ncbi:hypothetical protein IQ06DRAFT_367646 [Phaeosphaeriaceae sp. SRC1lsM3a]|nr:hypothetical protein IQ06DRAFT_367646 [Stagonospora sp. SRC1lsM3a]
MQFATILAALSFSSAALAAAVDTGAIVQGIRIRHADEPAATSLNIVQTPASDVQARGLDKRATGHLFVCTDSNFGGACQNLQFTTGQCLNLAAPFQDSISSAGPDAGFTCSVCSDNNCSGTCINTLVSPGIFDFGNFSPNINDQISSYRCN